MRWIIVCFIIVMTMVACKPAPRLGDEPPLILIEDADVQLSLTPGAAPVEQPLLLVLDADDVVAVTGEVIGVSMYMGRVPLQFSRQQNIWQSEFLLGACSDPDMQWQLQLEFEYANGEKRTLKQQFHSSW